jgi:hypothetical protein
MMELFKYFKKKDNKINKELNKPQKYKNQLKVYLNDGMNATVLSLAHECKKDSPKIKHWKNFYKWYFGRNQSKYFALKHATGEYVIKKDSILYFSVKILEENE